MRLTGRPSAASLRWACLSAGLLGSACAQAQSARASRYTPFDLKRPACRQDPGPAEGFACAGPGGWNVMVGFPAIGATIVLARPDRPRSREIDPGDGRSLVVDGLNPSGSPIEWRGTERAGRFEPDAAIMRVTIMDAAQRQEMIENGTTPARPLRGQVLMVYRLGPAGACRIAYVDAGANRDANDLARAAADAGTTCPVALTAVLGRSSALLEGALP